MKQYLILFALIFVAATVTDQLNADFNAGTLTNVNVTSNQVQLAGTGTYVSSGTFLSQVHDLGSNPTASISWTSSSPSGTSLLVSSRSGPTATPDSNWSSYSSSYSAPGGSTVTAPTNRYHQYRLQLATTNNASTPSVQAVTITYTPTGPQITADTANNAELNVSTNGTYRFYVNIQDTVTLSSVQSQYKIGSDAYTSASAMTAVNASRYYADIPEPTGGWENRSAELLSVRVQVTNTNADTEAETFTDLIDPSNYAPVVTTISDKTATSGNELSFTVTASDADADTLTYSTTHGSITKFTNTVADFSWTPTASDVGTTSVTVGVSDGTSTTNETFDVTTSKSNEEPSIRSISDKTYYYGAEVTFDVTVDENADENLTITSQPYLGLELISNSTTVYVARASFRALDDYKGTKTYTITARDDDGASDTETFVMAVNYCGDNVCQSQENDDTCPADCLSVQEARRSYIALEFPSRICTNKTIAVTAYNASSRYACFLEGKTTANAAAWCEQLEDVDLQFYRLDGEQRTDLGGASTNRDGVATFQTAREGRYRVVAEAEGLVGIEETFTVRACEDDIDTQRNVIRSQYPDVELLEQPPVTPRTERPELTPEETSMLSILIWYLMIPVLLASLIYVSNEYYDMYKDTDPKLLEMRIRAEELKQDYWPKIEPYYDKVIGKLEPLGKKLDKILWIPIGKKLKPLIQKFKK